MDNMGNRRFERTDFKVKGFVTTDEGECPVDIVNISMKGILVSAADPSGIEKGKTYSLRVSLPHSDISIETQATLMHHENNQCGFRFDSIEADSMIHLRRLLELNLSSGEEIERELTFLGD